MFRLISVFALALAVVSANGQNTATSSSHPSLNDRKLPGYAQAQKDRLAKLFETAERYGPMYRVQVNSREEKLLGVHLAKDIGEIDGERRFPVPSELVALWDYFVRFHLEGDVHGLDVSWENSDGAGGALAHWYKTDTANVFQARSVPTQTHLQYTVVVRGKGSLDAIRLLVRDEGGISSIFDGSPWSVLGADKPVLPVKVSVDLNSVLSIGGITDFETDKYFRLYAMPWGGPWGVHDYFLEHGFKPGRQIFKIYPALEIGYDDELPGKPPFVEDPDRPNHADPAFFESGWSWPETIPQGVAERYQGLDFVLCFDEWPSFNRHEGEGVVNSRGTPENFVAAAETAGRTLKFITEQTGITPKWIEVKNESDIPYEWSYHAAPGEDGWAKLAEFHNEVAEGMKAFVPGVMVGGPTTAYPNFAAADWNLARRHLTFMDQTKGTLDFYSHHFYEGDRLLFEDELRRGGNSYLLGRMTSYLDLIRAHQANTDNLVPLIITEYGSLSGGGEDHQIWKKLRNYSAYMVQYMQRPDELDVTVPFLIPFTWWSPEAKDGIFVFDSVDEKRDLSKLTANRPGMASGIPDSPMTGIHAGKARWFLDLWEGFNGQLVPVASDTPYVNVHAAADGNTLWIAASSVKSQRVAIDLSESLAAEDIDAVEQRRLYLDSGELQFEINDVSTQLQSLPLAAEETSVFKITLARPFTPGRTLTQHRHYGSRTLMPTGRPQSLMVAVSDLPDAGDIQKAVFRVSVQRKDGFNEPLTLTFNGQTLEVDLSESRGIVNYDTVREVEIPAEWIQQENQIVLDQSEEGGMLAASVLLLTTK
ncbi:MAG: hypothetical protein AAGJ38_02375 [Planctomycetota bacterium]